MQILLVFSINESNATLNIAIKHHRLIVKSHAYTFINSLYYQLLFMVSHRKISEKSMQAILSVVFPTDMPNI